MSEDAILASLTRLEAGLTRVESGQSTLRADVMGRVNRLQSLVEATRDELSLNMGATNTALDRTRSTRIEVENTTEILLAMQRQIMRLRVSIEDLQKKQS